MSNQREWSLDNLLSKLNELKRRLEQVMPQHRAALEKVAQVPAQFERSWWSARVDVLIQKARASYEKYQIRAQEAGLYATLMTTFMGMALKADSTEPVPLPDSPRVGISISSSGKIEPDLLNYPSKQEGVVLLSFEEFDSIAQRLKKQILEGTVVPRSEDEIPRLIFALASKSSGKSHGE